MRILRYFSTAFIDFFGITQPLPKEENQISWFIALLFASMLVLLVVVLIFVLHVLHG